MDEEKKVIEEETTSEKEELNEEGGGSAKKTGLALFVGILIIAGALHLSGTISLNGGSVVATVNGAKITEEDFDLRKRQIFATPELQGIEDPALIKSIEGQILDEIINTQLLLQTAKDAGFESSDDEVEAEYQLILERIGTASSTVEERKEILAVELAKSEMNDSMFRSNIADQLVIEKYLVDLIDESTLEPTEEEIASFYRQLTQTEADLPPLEDIRLQIADQILSQKRQQAVGGVIQGLRETAEILISE